MRSGREVEGTVSFWPYAFVASGAGELLTTTTPRWWRTPRVSQMYCESPTLRRGKARVLDSEVEATVARNIRKYRVEEGLRQVDLAHGTGMTQSRLSRLETGRCTPTPSELARLSVQLRCSIEEFFIARLPQQPLNWTWARLEVTIPRWLDVMSERNELPESHPIYD